MKTILSIFGTRPEAIKMVPVLKALDGRSDCFRSIVCVTAQHRKMLDQVLDLFSIRPDFDLDLMQPGQDLYSITADVLLGLKPVISSINPDLVLVHGDTVSTMTASLAAYYCRVPVGHVEAGLRTGSKYAPFPEEVNRRLTSVLADLHFAPTQTAKQNLLHEGITEESIQVTGNTVIDALLLATEKIKKERLESRIVDELLAHYSSLRRVFGDNAPLLSKKMLLVTGHRRENFGSGFESICQALKTIATSRNDIEIVYPVHLNPNVQEPVLRMLGRIPNIHLIEPLDYLPFVFLMGCSTLIITDSGGIQEEAPSLGKLVLVMRDTTERPEAISAGTSRLVGTDAARIVAETLQIIENPPKLTALKSKNPYGDGQAAVRIVNRLMEHIPSGFGFV
ncbi:MAG: UDP-N-acetylglucosamine 2-epimerase (non-hydrolyzing) [Desulfuromonadales bacterium]|nr:UDP-N-acetylglucosamine 2-epimerase (non-hydrolyzing) [Desulfuromonadales bacterium]